MGISYDVSYQLPYIWISGLIEIKANSVASVSRDMAELGNSNTFVRDINWTAEKYGKGRNENLFL